MSKNISKTIFYVSLSLISLIRGPGFNDEKYIYLDNLVSNTLNEKKVYVNKNLNSGLKDLGNLSLISLYEEAYIFLPKKKVFIEIGKDEKFINSNTNKSNSILISIDDILNIPYLKNENKIYIIHNHTENNLWLDIVNKQPISEKPNHNIFNKYNYSELVDNYNSNLRIYFQDYSFACPSLSDLFVMYNHDKKIKEKFPNLNVQFIIRSKYGETYYKMKLDDISLLQFFDSFNDVIQSDQTLYGRNVRAKYFTIDFFYKPAKEKKNRKLNFIQ
jgi:hypothetical protein